MWGDELGAGPQAGPTRLSSPSAPGPGPDTSRRPPVSQIPPSTPHIRATVSEKRGQEPQAVVVGQPAGAASVPHDPVLPTP